VIVVDTSVILAFMNSADDHHVTVCDWLQDEDDDLVRRH
jgi:predicted nucleic acid-binding protein